MTKIKYRSRPVWHETGLIDRMSGRMYVVAESPASLLIRLKGTRTILDLPWSMAFLRAAQLKVALANLNKVNKKRSVSRGRV